MPEPEAGFVIAATKTCPICGEPWHEAKDCYKCPACGSGMTMTMPPEDAARCLACLLFWSPSTRRRKDEPMGRLGWEKDAPPSVTDDLG